MNILVRALVLCNALLVALPPGWCCLPAAVQPASPRDPAPCCHHKPAPDQPAPPTHPQPVKPCDAPRCLTDATRAPVPETPPADLVPAALLAVPDAAPLPRAARVAEASELHALSPPPQLLHCVWLC